MTSQSEERAPVKPRKPRPKPPRSVQWLERPAPRFDGFGAARLTVGKDTGTYLVRQIEADFGESAWELEKLDADLQTVETYHVLLCGRESSCTCRGCVQHGHCKHLDGLKALDQRGQLPRLLRQKHSACPRCNDLSEGGVLCPGCAAEDDFEARAQAAELEAAGIDPWACTEAEHHFETNERFVQETI